MPRVRARSLQIPIAELDRVYACALTGVLIHNFLYAHILYWII